MRKVASPGSLRRRAAALALAFAAALASATPTGAAAGEPATFEAAGSVEQVYATGLPAGTEVSLTDRRGELVDATSANEQGGALFRRVEPGRGYRVSAPGEGEAGPLRVLTQQSAPPDQGIYDQELPEDGYGYLETRDGTELAISVRPPGDVLEAFGFPAPDPGTPTPTLVEYSGYGYARPSGPESGISVLANLMGFTVVDVNMRGTGCSGGAFDFFEPLQSLDGYDVVETVARQPWVEQNDAGIGKVGMMGISYGGISQLFTAATVPPSLAAISPLSVLDGVQTTLYPGGILNTGFALEWAKDRIARREARRPRPGPAMGVGAHPGRRCDL